MAKDKDNRDRDDKRSDGNKYDRMANIPGSGNETIDRRREEAQDQSNRDRKEQQGEED
jgi:hypothetical protein